MIPATKNLRKRILQFPIPLQCLQSFQGPIADDLAKFSYLLLLYSLPYEERRDFGYYIPFPEVAGRRYFKDRWHRVRKATETEYRHIFDWNNRYSNFQGNSFPKSVRLRDEYRTGECVLYTTQKKYNPIQHFDKSKLDPVTSKLVDDFGKFRLPDEPPVFENPWQALAWDRISSGDYYATRCEYGRVHTPFTSFKHRTQLASDEGPLAALDVVGCQMLCLGTIIKKTFGDSPDLTKWLDICSQSDIYSHMAQVLGYSRSNTKSGLIRCVFERSHQMKQMLEFSALEREFPTVASGILTIKQIHGYQTVARLCQTLESSILIDETIPQVSDIPLITIHDEYILPVRSIARVKQAVQEGFRRHGVVPQFKEVVL